MVIKFSYDMDMFRGGMNRILLLSHEFSPFPGGAGSVARELFIGLQKSKIDVSLCTHRNAIAEGVGHILRSTLVTKQHSAVNYLKYYLYLFLKVNKYKVIIVNDFFFTLFSIFLFTKEQCNKTYHYVHGCEIEALLSHKINTFLNGKLCHSYIKMLTLSKGVVFVSDFVKNEFFKTITEKLNISCDDCNIIKSKSMVIHNGIDDSLFYRVNSSSPAKKRIVTTSRITKMKGYDTMLDAMIDFLSINKDYCWEIIGSGDYLSTLNGLINKLNKDISSRIKLLGNVERKELKYIYSDASVFLLLSDYDEAHPLVYMEAALCGLPSIAWNKGGCPEAIINGKTGILIDEINELQHAINESVKIDKNTVIDSSINFYSQKMIDSWVSLLK